MEQPSVLPLPAPGRMEIPPRRPDVTSPPAYDGISGRKARTTSWPEGEDTRGPRRVNCESEGENPALRPSHLHLFLAPFPCLHTAGKALARSLCPSLSLPPSLRKQWRMAPAEQALLVRTQTARRPLANESAALPRPANRRRRRWRDGAGPRGHREVPRAGIPRSAGSRWSVSVPCRSHVEMG